MNVKRAYFITLISPLSHVIGQNKFRKKKKKRIIDSRTPTSNSLASHPIINRLFQIIGALDCFSYIKNSKKKNTTSSQLWVVIIFNM